MKTKRSIITTLTLCVKLSLTACTGKEPAKTDDTQNTTMVSSTEQSTNDTDAKLNDL